MERRNYLRVSAASLLIEFEFIYADKELWTYPE